MTAGELLRELLAVTPPPPASVEDLTGLLVMMDTMTSAREAVLVAAGPVRITTDAERALHADLITRQRGWEDALAGARLRLIEQRLGANKLRAYTAGVGGGRR